ncbi:MAG: glucose-6-phosphate isomerase, partial [Bacteroidota bacterium]
MLHSIDPTSCESWSQLAKEAGKGPVNIKDLLSENPDRVNQFSFEFEKTVFDFSKSSVTENVMSLLQKLAEDCHLKEAITALFSGEPINKTENRAVLHTALRDLSATNENSKVVKKELEKIRKFASAIQNESWLGYTGKPITDVVNIGIGGSDLGPKMVTHALRKHWKRVRPHFISNVDGAQLVEELEDLNPETTLFIIASKTFT